MNTCELHQLPGLDALYTGTHMGKTPTGWLPDGWLLSLRDRMSRTDDVEMRDRSRCEIASIKTAIEA